uniref:proline-rich protein HaeIII subfamily 1-like n=1 Tax=Jaculus jaculus TaxID=51337 RepID=UPI001E1B0470|nr:proline-rich protein HaeIII subfamily 1-like [Jaculus jaculus]
MVDATVGSEGRTVKVRLRGPGLRLTDRLAEGPAGHLPSGGPPTPVTPFGRPPTKAQGRGETTPTPRSPGRPPPRRTRGRCLPAGGRQHTPRTPASTAPRPWGWGRGTRRGRSGRTCRLSPAAPARPPPPHLPAPRRPRGPLTSARPGPAPRSGSPRPAPLHALSPPSAPPAAPGPPPPPAPSRRRPLRGHNGAAAAPLMHMHDAAPPAPPPRPEQRSPEPARRSPAGGEGRPRACAAAGREVGPGPRGWARGRHGPTATGAPRPLHTFRDAASESHGELPARPFRALLCGRASEPERARPGEVRRLAEGPGSLAAAESRTLTYTGPFAEPHVPTEVFRPNELASGLVGSFRCY